MVSVLKTWFQFVKLQNFPFCIMWGFMVAHFSVSVPVLSRRGLGYSYSNTEGKYQGSGSNWIEKIAKISLKNIVYLFKIFFLSLYLKHWEKYFKSLHKNLLFTLITKSFFFPKFQLFTNLTISHSILNHNFHQNI